MPRPVRTKKAPKSLEDEEPTPVQPAVAKQPKASRKRKAEAEDVLGPLPNPPPTPSITTSKLPVATPLNASGIAPNVNEHFAGLGPNAKVVAPYFATLNQTVIEGNNNKYYKLQVIQSAPSSYHLGTHWGRVGEKGASKLVDFSTEEEAAKAFMKTFSEKSGNKWDARGSFVKKAGKYDLINIATEPASAAKIQAATNARNTSSNSSNVVVAPSRLDEDTKDIVEMVFDKDMFRTAMADINIDTEKLPLGALDKTQLDAGNAVLVELQQAIKNRATSSVLSELSSRFYTVIPHSFGRNRPPVISSADAVQRCFDNMAILSDIATAEELSSEANDSVIPSVHPTDALYESLGAGLTYLSKSTAEFKLLTEYASAHGAGKPSRAWTIDREDPRNDRFASLGNRRLLWHGTNVAVVAAILKSGLRIMPHSGGRIGKGIYSASMREKSLSYTRGAQWRGRHRSLMFVTEVALGDVHWIVQDNPSLCKPPTGKQSVVALGTVYPDPAGEKTLKMDGRDVILPVGKKVLVSGEERSTNSFAHSEYVVYDEGQVKLRYLIEFD